MHGFNDHHTAFDEFGAWAAGQGLLVEAYDQRGFGANPDRGLWAGTAAMAEDLRRHPPAPGGASGRASDVLGESMGAAVATVALTDRGAPEVDGIVLSAPAVWGGQALNPLYRATLWTMRHLVPGLTLSGRGLGKRASDNIPMLQALGADPLFIKETRVDAIGGLVDLMSEARDRGPALAPRKLVLVGEHDEIVPTEAQQGFVASLPARDCTLITYPAGWHLLLRDLQREKVWATSWPGSGARCHRRDWLRRARPPQLGADTQGELQGADAVGGTHGDLAAIADGSDEGHDLVAQRIAHAGLDALGAYTRRVVGGFACHRHRALAEVDRDVDVMAEQPQPALLLQAHPAGGEVGRAAAGKAQPDADHVVAPGQHRHAHGIDMARRLADQQCHQVEVVDQQIEHHVDIGASSAERGEPVPLDEQRLADQRHRRGKGGVEALEVPDLEDRPAGRSHGVPDPQPRRASAASGFSIRQWMPASSSGPATAWWDAVGTTTLTASTLPISRPTSVSA